MLEGWNEFYLLAGSAAAVTFSIQARRDTLPAVLELLRQVLREPALPRDQFELLREERIAAIEQMRTEPTMLAPRRFRRSSAQLRYASGHASRVYR